MTHAQHVLQRDHQVCTSKHQFIPKHLTLFIAFLKEYEPQTFTKNLAVNLKVILNWKYLTGKILFLFDTMAYINLRTIYTAILLTHEHCLLFLPTPNSLFPQEMSLI